MFVTKSIVALGLAVLAAAQDQPNFRFSSYGSSDTTCAAQNLISPTVSVPGTGAVLSCVQFATGTNSIQYALLDGSKAGCRADLFTNNNCLGPAIKTVTPAVGEQACVPPLGGGWQSVRVTCP